MIEKLGEGKSSEVVLMKHKSTLELFAVKVYTYKNKYSSTEKSRMRREIDF